MRGRAWWIDVVLGGVLTLAAVSPSAAQGHNTAAFVTSNHHECVGVPGCVSEVKPAVAVPARSRTQTRFACSQSQPHLWGWDVGQHEHISVQLTAVNRSSATLVATNHADVEGSFVVYLGCSTAPYAGTVLQDSRYLAPTGWVPGTSLRTPDVAGDPRKQQSAPPGHECDGVPLCQVLGTYQFDLTGWESRLIHYTCQGEYPYATFNYSYSQTGYASVGAFPTIFAVVPQTLGIAWTNWNPFQTDTVTVTIACSKNNSFGGDCGGPVGDPGCPVVSQHTYCSRGPVPVCILVFEERCQPNNQLYSCTDTLGLTYCQQCPG
jgi:hypothetical protein